MKKLLYNTYFLVGAHVALITCIIFMLINADYQIRFYNALVARVTTSDMNEQDKAVALMNSSYLLVSKSNEILNLSIKPGIKEMLFGSSEEVVAGGGTCGGFVQVAGRALKTAGYHIRIAQMKIGEVYGGHIILEVLIDGQYRVLDPSFNTVYRKNNGELATIQEINADWGYFRQQVPQRYNPADNRIEVRYTNWNKVPIIMPLLRQVLLIFLGADVVDHISIRAHLIEAYRVRAQLLALVYMAVLVLTVLSAKDRKKRLKI